MSRIPDDDFCTLCNIEIKHCGTPASREHSWQGHLGSRRHLQNVSSAQQQPPLQPAAAAAVVAASRQPSWPVPPPAAAGGGRTEVTCPECNGKVRFMSGDVSSELHSWQQHVNHSNVHTRWLRENRAAHESNARVAPQQRPATSSNALAPSSAALGRPQQSLQSTLSRTSTQGSDGFDRLPPSSICPICFYPMAAAMSIEPCQHTHCKKCTLELRRQHHKCPLCRGVIKSVRDDMTLSKVITELLESISSCPTSSIAPRAVASGSAPHATPLASVMLPPPAPRADQATPVAVAPREVPQALVIKYSPICPSHVTETVLRRILSVAVERGFDNNKIVDMILGWQSP
jgi:hypothetical protein